MDIEFQISDTARIECRPKLPIGVVAPFNTIDMVLVLDDQEHILYDDDYAVEAARRFYPILESLIHGGLELVEKVRSTGIGQYCAYYCANIAHDPEDLVSQYNVWSTRASTGNSTWMYRPDGIIYIEITPDYIWAFEDPDDPEYIQLDEFLRDYKNKAKFRIEPDTLREWHETCAAWLKSMEQMLEEEHYVSED